MIDALTRAIGRTVAWLTAAMALVTVAVVVLRYLFGEGTVALQELITYAHVLVIALGMSYALQSGAHVRVDVIYGRLSRRRQALVDLFGHCAFLLPVAVLIFWTSLPWVMASWRIFERSPEVGGLPAVFLLKTLIPVMAVLLALQGLAEIGRALRALREAPAAS
jgi:TRAP-type mannitol/chloroaromatic compound transport system permease small subunit